MKILIVAQNASTRFGGEAIIPVHYFRSLLERRYSVELMAHARNRADLEEIFPADQEKIHYIKDTNYHRLIWKIGNLFPRRISDGLFGFFLNLLNEYYQRKMISRLVRANRVDVIHQPIPVSPKAPSSIHGFGVPVIIGPMNGGMIFPPGWGGLESKSERIFVWAARIVAPLLNSLLPGKKHASALLVANQRTLRALPVTHNKVIELVENGVDRTTFHRQSDGTKKFDQSLRLVFMGRLVSWKAVDVTLAAVAEARARHLEVTLEILGDGPERSRLVSLAKDLGLSDSVNFHGFLPQVDCSAALEEADALILNSVYECGGAVVLEAMSVGLPVIASNWGGPADYLTDDCGVLVAPSPRDTFAVRLADAIERLAKDPKLCFQMGKAAASRVEKEFDWERKVEKIIDIYEKAIREREIRNLASP